LAREGEGDELGDGAARTFSEFAVTFRGGMAGRRGTRMANLSPEIGPPLRQPGQRLHSLDLFAEKISPRDTEPANRVL
jgi:hypothetical protein